MDIKDFATSFMENIMVSIELSGTTQEDEVTSDIIEYIKDTGDIVEPPICHFKQRGIKVNAYDYDEDSNTLDLFVTVLKPDTVLQKVSDSDIEDAYTKVYKFYLDAISGKMISKIDESNEDAYEMVQSVEEAKGKLEHLRLFVLTNGLASLSSIPPSRIENNIRIDYHLWDIGRVYQQYSIKAGKQKIEIDFPTDYNHKLKCLKMEDVSGKVNVYLSIIPGKILADIYGKYQQGLLEKNVRTFLQFKAKVNRGIRKSISEEPDMFFAYNNGISTTAEDIEIVYEGNTPYITRITNWQIVNGGQTTASIFASSQDKSIDLSHVFVQMKLSVMKKDIAMDLVVPNISKYANSQTAIKDSDFSSNDPYHVHLEMFSRQEWIPSLTGGKATSKWFYERTRGQYLDEQSQKSSADLKRFKIEYPKQNKFTKTNLAKYEMSWWQRPHDVSKGAENNYGLFESELKKNPIEVNKVYFHRLIAKAVLFRDIDQFVMKKQLGGYKANMVSYLIALISDKTNRKLNLDIIWENQSLSDNLYEAIDEMIPIVWEHITHPLKPGMNIGEWCKKVDCWSSLKEKYINTDKLQLEIVSEVAGDIAGLQDLSPAEVKLLDEAANISPVIWFTLSKWAKEKNLLSPLERKTAYNFGALANRNQKFTLKQAKFGLKLLKQAKDLGFNP